MTSCEDMYMYMSSHVHVHVHVPVASQVKLSSLLEPNKVIACDQVAMPNQVNYCPMLRELPKRYNMEFAINEVLEVYVIIKWSEMLIKLLL